MKDYIWGRIHALRKNYVIDFLTEYMKRTGANLEDMRNDPLQSLQLPSKSVNYAKVEKNIQSSPLKLASLRFKKETK